MIERSTLMNVCLMVSQVLVQELEMRNVQKPESVPDRILFKFRPPDSTELTGIRDIVRFCTVSIVYSEQCEATTAKDRLEELQYNKR
ncbi:hypothetical protein ONS96_000590 [Cadophora gregata f. sp. sojae]|nr:hypothetical protein ONS96_000590 [Cadophora gregata f. sp. sojae]